MRIVIDGLRVGAHDAAVRPYMAAFYACSEINGKHVIGIETTLRPSDAIPPEPEAYTVVTLMDAT